MNGGKIGRLRHRVVLQRPVRGNDEGGTATITWEPIAPVFAAIEALSGSELERSDGLAARATHRVTLRYRADVSPDMRIILGARTFEIRAALDVDGRKRWLQCHCEELVP